MKKRDETAISVIIQILVLLIVVATIGAALYVYVSSVAPGVSAPTGFTQTSQSTQDGNAVTTYSGTGAAQDARNAFRTWMEGQGWEYKMDNGSFGGYTGQLYEKGNEMAVVQVTSTQAEQVTVIVVSGPKPVVTAQMHSLSISAESPKTAGQSSAIMVRAYDAENNPVSGASISLSAAAMEGTVGGDYAVELALSDQGNGNYTAELTSTCAGLYSIIAAVEGTDIQTSAQVEFTAGATADVIVSYTSPKPASSLYKSTVTFYFADAYGNSIPPDRVQPGISVSEGWSVEDLESRSNGSFSFDLVAADWGTATANVRDNLTGMSENFDVAFTPLYFETEQNLAPTSIGLATAENEDGGIVATWGDNTISLKIGVFFPTFQLGSYEITFDYDSSALQLVGVRDWDNTDGLAAPSLTVLGENSMFMISQMGSAPPGGVDIAIVDFTPRKPGKTNVTATALELSKICPETGNLIPVEVPSTAPVVVAKPLKKLIVPLKFWIVENSGQTEADARREAEEVENNLNKSSEDCRLDYRFVCLAEINHVPKSIWDNIVGADNKLNDGGEWTKLDNYRFTPGVSAEGYRKWINIFLVPRCSPRHSVVPNAIGWSGGGLGAGSIVSDLTKDLHNRNLTHELVHTFSKSKVKDSPDDASVAQGGREPNNIMRYCGGGKEISENQGKILNEEIAKRVVGDVYQPGP